MKRTTKGNSERKIIQRIVVGVQGEKKTKQNQKQKETQKEEDLNRSSFRLALDSALEYSVKNSTENMATESNSPQDLELNPSSPYLVDNISARV